MQGEVVSNKQAKTVVVKVERRFTHPVMKKTVRSSKKYYAHDEKNECAVGDTVNIEEHAPDLEAEALGRGSGRPAGEINAGLARILEVNQRGVP